MAVEQADYDIVIRGGTVLDGSGGDPFVADVGLRDGRIERVGTVLGLGREEIDATGLSSPPASSISTPTSTHNRSGNPEWRLPASMASPRSSSAIAESALRPVGSKIARDSLP